MSVKGVNFDMRKVCLLLVFVLFVICTACSKSDSVPYRVDSGSNTSSSSTNSSAGATGTSDRSETLFKRTEYFTGTSRTDLLRNPDTYSNKKVYFERCIVTQIYEPKLYLAETSWGGYIIIDDTGNSGSNALTGDRVSVYGKFSKNTTITWTDGSKEQVPTINVDLLIFNNTHPTPEDFALALVDCLNAYQHAYGQSQYISGATVKLLCGISHAGVISVQSQHDALGVNTVLYVPFIDGYQPKINWRNPTGIDTELLRPYSGYDTNLIWVTGNVISFSSNMLDSAMIDVTIEVTSIEPHDSSIDAINDRIANIERSDDSASDDYRVFTTVEGNVIITAYLGNDSIVTIPSLIGGRTVTGIAGGLYEGAFENRSSLISVIIPDGVMFIDSNAFKDCVSLTSIVIPESVTSISNNSFAGCFSLPQETKAQIARINSGALGEQVAVGSEIYYEYHPILSYFGYRSRDMHDKFNYYDYDVFSYSSTGDSFIDRMIINDEITLIFESQWGVLAEIQARDPRVFEIGGRTISNTRAGLIGIFGDTQNQGWDSGIYVIEYYVSEYLLTFLMNSPDSEVFLMMITIP